MSIPVRQAGLTQHPGILVVRRNASPSNRFASFTERSERTVHMPIEAGILVHEQIEVVGITEPEIVSMESGTTVQIERCFGGGERAQDSILQGVQDLLVVVVGFVYSVPARTRAQSRLIVSGVNSVRTSSTVSAVTIRYHTASFEASARTVPVCRDGPPVRDGRVVPRLQPPAGSGSPTRSFSQYGQIPVVHILSVVPIGEAAKVM